MANGLPHDEPAWARFRELLDEQTTWPSEYMFKFIAPQDKLEDLKKVLAGHPVSIRESSKGNYISVTATIEVYSSEHVVAVYSAVAEIEGVILL
jgi:uncharacterized protein